ncbi:MAG: thioredoxin domain-containing protein [Planctomycetaceae bacterium]
MNALPALLLALATSAAPGYRGEVLDFSATWCGPCQQVAPTVAKLEREGLPIRKVDFDQNREYAQRMGVQSLPTFVLVIDGKEVQRQTGAVSEQQLRSWLKQIPRAAAVADASAPPAGNVPYVADPQVRLGTGTTSSPQWGDDRGPSTRGNADVAVTTNPSPYPAEHVSALAESERERANADTTYRGSNSLLDGVGPPNQQPAITPQMAASGRLRVTIDGHINLGSGTIIESRDGIARLITCAHIFRGFNESSRIEVHLFEDGQEVSYPGDLIRFDAESDVGLIQIQCDRPLPVINVARGVQNVQVDEPVLSIGCSGGQPPTEQSLKVTTLNPFEGPATVECTGVPVQGRSGGGLFRSGGELVGICIAADPARQRGVYAGLDAVHALLGAAGLAHLYQAPQAGDFAQPSQLADAATNSSAPDREHPGVGGSLLHAFPGVGGQERQERDAEPFNLLDDASRRAEASGELAQLAGYDDAEIVCIIRPRNRPESESQIVVIHQASPKLLTYLRGELPAGERHSGTVPAALTRSEVPTHGSQPSTSHKPSLQETTLSHPARPRRYVRSR